MNHSPDCVILVDSDDRVIGVMEKMEAHRQGVLHRAISVFVFSDMGDLLLQRRAYGKYHTGGLWTNTCCSHPRPSETTLQAAHRRLREEMGLECELRHAFSFIYRADLDNDLVEHELDHVLIGISDAEPTPDPSEVSEWRRVRTDEIRREMDTYPDRFTPWFRVCFETAVLAHAELRTTTPNS